MKLVATWAPKGGTGKTTMTLNVAAAAVRRGLKPLVICRDPQGSALLFSQEGALPFPVIESIPDKKPKGIDLVLFDCVAADWSLPGQNVIMMPTLPTRDSHRVYLGAKAQAEKSNKTVVPILNRLNSSRADERNAATAMKRGGGFTVADSTAFGRAAADWTTIFDDRLSKAYKVNERRNEMLLILDKLLEVA